MDDWRNHELALELDNSAFNMVRPPAPLLGVTALLGVLAAICFLIDNRLGYLIGTVASVMGGIAALVNLQRMADSNYIHLDWFVPLLRLVRYAILAITLGHVVVLAIDVANGAQLW